MKSGASILGETDFSSEALKNVTLQAEEILKQVTDKIQETALKAWELQNFNSISAVN
jgi:hypothetical protein